MPSRDFTSEDLFSSRMISMQSSTHSSQMNTVGPAISLRTSCWLLPQNEQYRSFSPPTLSDMPAFPTSPSSSQECKFTVKPALRRDWSAPCRPDHSSLLDSQIGSYHDLCLFQSFPSSGPCVWPEFR